MRVCVWKQLPMDCYSWLTSKNLYSSTQSGQEIPSREIARGNGMGEEKERQTDRQKERKKRESQRNPCCRFHLDDDDDDDDKTR